MPSSIPALLLIALLVWGCAGTPAPALPEAAPPAAAQPTMASGTLAQVDGAWRFQPPGDAKPLPVPADVVAVIDQIVAGQVTPGRATLMVGAGEAGPQIVGWRCIECGPPPADARWAMHGTEPFWALVLKGDAGQWATPDTSPLILKVESGGEAAGPWTLKSADGTRTMTVRIEEETCEDGMADARWPATAHVELDGFAMRGCAIAGR